MIGIESILIFIGVCVMVGAYVALIHLLLRNSKMGPDNANPVASPKPDAASPAMAPQATQTPALAHARS